MPSAGRPFSDKVIASLRDKGVGWATLTLHTGVASLENDEPPYEEWYEVPARTTAAINEAHRLGRRVIAVGTTVVRAIESAVDGDGLVHASHGAGYHAVPEGAGD
jgi:S-adenosylmethionine:tRNA ribosyltransferase-isomerase